MQHQAIISYVPAYLRRLFLADIEVQQAERYALMTECLRLSSEEHSKEEILHSPALFAKLADKLTPRDLVTGMHGLSLVPGLAFRGTPVSVDSLELVLPMRLKTGLPQRINHAIVLLKDAIVGLQRKAWTAMKLQGASMRALEGIELAPRAAQSPHMQRPRLFPIQVRKFAILLQSNNINCRTNLYLWKLAPTAACPLCAHSTETVLHILNNCPNRMHLTLGRHDAIHDVLKPVRRKKWPEADGFKHLSDTRPDSLYSSSSLRPDEIAVMASRRKRDGSLKSDGTPNSNFAEICDVKSPFPQSGFLFKVDLANVVKYDPIRRQYAKKLGRATVSTLIIPSTGPTPMVSYTTLRKAGCDGRSVSKVLREMNIAVTKANFAFASTLSPPTRSPHPL
jgi:hypothetical protein